MKDCSTEEDRQAIVQAQQQVAGLTPKELSEQVQILSDEFFDSAIDDSVFDLSETIFFVKVWFPCWLIYGETPTCLIRKARLGDLKAFEKLLRLDTNVLHDKKIAGHSKITTTQSFYLSVSDDLLSRARTSKDKSTTPNLAHICHTPNFRETESKIKAL